MFNLSLQTPLDVAMKAVHQQMKLDHRATLRTLDVPCLALQSDHDFYPVGLGRYIADSVAGGQCRILRDCGHTAQLQNHAVFNQALRDFMGT